MPHPFYILFFFAVGACIGSFLNVVVWRLPRGESLVTPPSHCPKCKTPLAWYDNVPVFGWLFLRGKCRYCKQPISSRYPIIEFITGVLFVLYYFMFFIVQQGPVAPGLAEPVPLTIEQHWPIYLLSVFTVSALLAASLIDAAEFFIPASIPILLAAAGLLFHAICDTRQSPGAVSVMSPGSGALAAGAGIGLLFSVGMRLLNWLPASFEHGWPLLEHEREEMKKEIAKLKREGKEAPELPPVWSRKQINVEMGKEMLFLLPPIVLGLLWVVLTWKVPAVRQMWLIAMQWDWLAGLLGALLGGMVGGFVVWLTRILGSLGFGREAMGMGDVDLMFGVGAIVGAGAATVAFFVAPFFGLAVAVYMVLFGKRRELPYGPYLSLATAFVMIYWGPIRQWLMPGVYGMIDMLRIWAGG